MFLILKGCHGKFISKSYHENYQEKPSNQVKIAYGFAIHKTMSYLQWQCCFRSIKSDQAWLSVFLQQ